MRLSSLKLSGFKSFADSTTLHFKQNRTAVVGPNGCGKSNVIDAIRWVMGESSARQLRGGSMQDVIFTGTAKRKPVGMASVELRFENTQGKLGGAYNAYTELAVRRQVNREGKSEYFLNGTRCRRRDITDIFLGTGLGPRSYAIIEQGMINRLVDAKPEDMRVFIEEAAGISRYQARRRETAQHLEHTQQNLERLDDIAQELKTQMRSLSRQAEAAQHYRQLEENILSLKVEILSYQAQQAQFQQEKYTLELSEYGEQFKLVRSELNTVEQDLEQTTALFQRIVAESAPLQQQWQQAEQQRSKLKNEVEHKQRISSSNRHKLKHLEEEKHTLKQKIQVIELQLDTLHEEHEAAQDAQRSSTEKLAEKQQDFSNLKSQSNSTQQQYLQSQQQHQQLLNKQQNMQQQLLQVEKNLQRIQAQREQLQSQQQAQLDDVDTQLEQLIAQDDTLKLEIDTAQLAEQQQQLSLNTLEAEMTQAKQVLRTLEDELQRIATEVKTLESLMQSASSEIEADFQGTRLWQQMRLTDAAKPYAALIEKIYAQWLHAAYLEENDEFHPQRYLQVKSHSKPQLSESPFAEIGLVELAAWIEHPQCSLWQQVWICRDYATACQHRHLLGAGQSLLSLDGYHVGVDWQVALHVANPHADQVAQGQLVYQVQLDHLQPLLQEKQQECTQARAALADLEQRCQTEHDVLKRQQQQRQQNHVQRQQLQVEMTKLQSLKQAYTQQQVQQREQVALLEQAYDDEAMQRDELDIDLHALQMKLDQLAPQLKADDMAWSNLQTELEQDETEIQQLQHAAQQAQVELQHKHSQIQLLEKDLAFLNQSYQQVIEQIQQAQQYLAPVQDELPHLETELEQQTVYTAKIQQDLYSAQSQLTEVQQKQQQLNTQRQHLQQQDDTLRAALEQTRLQWHSAKTEHQHLLSQLAELNQSIKDNVEIDVASHQQKLQQLQQKFEKLGPVNLAAALELDDIKQRYDELSHQIDDLQTTVQQLLDAMKSIDQETKKLFMTTFDQVNTELQNLFPKVFEGGEASLSLEDDWQSGVKLMARPPGKKNTSLALLSGGEKALTALALVFAIFRLNPAPFCVLDEVDAPLDDANVKRFCNLVKELSDQVQFIYITHNKVAMTMATTLLGVTMPEPGTSKLVTVDLAHAEAYGLVRES